MALICVQTEFRKGNLWNKNVEVYNMAETQVTWDKCGTDPPDKCIYLWFY
jgi:hypothetical protein